MRNQIIVEPLPGKNKHVVRENQTTDVKEKMIMSKVIIYPKN